MIWHISTIYITHCYDDIIKTLLLQVTYIQQNLSVYHSTKCTIFWIFIATYDCSSEYIVVILWKIKSTLIHFPAQIHVKRTQFRWQSRKRV